MSLINARPEGYDPSQVWDEETGTWITDPGVDALSGGRVKNNLIAVSDNGKIYVYDPAYPEPVVLTPFAFEGPLEGSDWLLYGEYWGATTFTVPAENNGPITAMEIMLKVDAGDNPGTITVSLRDTDAEGVPTGDDLCSATLDGSTLTTVLTWYEFTFADGPVLDAGHKYAIIVRCDGVDRLYVGVNASNGYAGGNYFYGSPDPVNAWDPDTELDMLFRIS
jgi:hypothetical protein